MSHNGAENRQRCRRGTINDRKRRRIRPTLMALEDRRLLATFVVNNPTDTTILGETDLRQAITSANSTPGANTITFDSTIFASAQTIALTGAQLTLSNTTGTQTITVPTAGVTVSGDGLSRVFQVDANVTASISGMTITGGKTVIYNGGGGLENYGTVTLSNCTISGNSATTGGGLANYHAATLTNCTISGNSTSNNGSGGGLAHYEGTVALNNCTVSNNSTSGPYGDGGGVWSLEGTVTLNNCTVSGNSRNERLRRRPAIGERHKHADRLHDQRQLR